MRLEPQHAGRNGGIKPDFLPPRGFITAAMHLAMVPSTQGDGELIADLATKRPALRKAQVMGIRGLATANQTRLLGHMSDVVAGPECDAARTKPARSCRLSSIASRPSAFWMDEDRAQSGAARPSLTSEVHLCQALQSSSILLGRLPRRRRASAAVSLFFSASDRCAQSAASSPPASSLISSRSRSRSAADASGPSDGSAGFD